MIQFQKLIFILIIQFSLFNSIFFHLKHQFVHLSLHPIRFIFFQQILNLNSFLINTPKFLRFFNMVYHLLILIQSQHCYYNYCYYHNYCFHCYYNYQFYFNYNYQFYFIYNYYFDCYLDCYFLYSYQLIIKFVWIYQWLHYHQIIHNLQNNQNLFIFIIIAIIIFFQQN